MDLDNREQYTHFLLQSHVDTRLVEFRDHDALRMVSVIDRLEDGLSSVYTFYDPDLPRSAFGTYGILWQIEACRHLGLPYVYLGYLIGESPKMAYKARFRPLQALRNGQWEPYSNPSCRRPRTLARQQPSPDVSLIATISRCSMTSPAP